MPKIKRGVKDSVFTYMFRQPEYTRQLYLALHPEDADVTEDEFKLVTLENVLTVGFYNDLGIQVRGRLILLVEAQSTFSENISLRMLMYLASTYKEYVEEEELDLYGARAVAIPRPELYVVYTGTRENVPDTLHLSDLYDGHGSVDLEVKVLQDSGTGDIVDQYVRFCRLADENVKRHGRTEQAILETLRVCREQGILTPFLASRQKEVRDIMVTLFDQEKILELHDLNVAREAKNEGRQEGRREGRQEGIMAMALRMLEAGKYALEDIAALAGMSVDELKKLQAEQNI